MLTTRGIWAGLLIAAATALASSGVFAQQMVEIGGSRTVLLRPASPRASVILMPGGDGGIGAADGGRITSSLRGNQLVRTRYAYRDRGLAVLIVDASTNLSAAVKYMAAIKRPVTVIATSGGTIRAARGIASGARPDALVLTAGLLTNESGSRENVRGILGSPQALPRTLVIHHRHDACRLSLPAGVEPFVRWAAGKANATWLDGGKSSGNPCEAWAYHGFNGIDDRVVALAAAFR